MHLAKAPGPAMSYLSFIDVIPQTVPGLYKSGCLLAVSPQLEVHSLSLTYDSRWLTLAPARAPAEPVAPREPVVHAQRTNATARIAPISRTRIAASVRGPAPNAPAPKSRRSAAALKFVVVSEVSRPITRKCEIV